MGFAQEHLNKTKGQTLCISLGENICEKLHPRYQRNFKHNTIGLEESEHTHCIHRQIILCSYTNTLCINTKYISSVYTPWSINVPPTKLHVMKFNLDATQDKISNGSIDTFGSLASMGMKTKIPQ